jgi:hypothetical protein
MHQFKQKNGKAFAIVAKNYQKNFVYSNERFDFDLNKDDNQKQQKKKQSAQKRIKLPVDYEIDLSEGYHVQNDQFLGYNKNLKTRARLKSLHIKSSGKKNA